MHPLGILFWMAFYIACPVLILVFLIRLRWSKWKWDRIKTLGVIAVLSGVMYTDLAEPPVTPKENPGAYEVLLEQLVDYYGDEKGGAIQFDLHRHSPLPEDHPIRYSMEELRISCLLYVHDRWGQQYQRGLLVAGRPKEKFGSSVFKSYKIIEGEFVTWPETERPRGPIIYQGRKSYMRGGSMYCSNSG